MFKESNIVDDDEITVCSHCYLALTLEEGHLSSKICWPAFMWLVLKNQSLRRYHGIELWRIIPKTWRRWWICQANTLSGFENVTVDYPDSFFVDVTKEKFQVDDAINNL